MAEKQRNITIKTKNRISNKFQYGKAWTINGLANEMNIHPYTIETAIYFLLLEDKIIRLDSSTNGQLYIKNG